MEEVRQLVQEEGREARNLVAFHVAVDSPVRISRKPPRSIIPPVRRVAPRAASRRSASAGRDKRSELRARCWALLFGDLQRAIGEIYHTVEAHENLNECQEVILVLENYTRDFKALGEWFRLKWEYDNTPPPQRPQSLAWEIRKTDFVRPESRRTFSVKSSPSVSGKNSPSLSGHNTPSGKNSPNLTGKASPGSGKISPRVPSGHSSTSPKANIEFFSNKLTSKITAKPEPKAVKEPRLSDIKEKDIKDSPEESETVKETLKSKDLNQEDKQDVKPLPVVEIGKAKECSNIAPKQVIIKSSNNDKMTKKCANKTSSPEISPQAKAIIDKLDVMENEFLTKHLTENEAKNENLLNQEKSVEMSPKMDKPNEQEIGTCNKKNEENQEDKTLKEKGESVESLPTESPTKSEDNFADVSNDSSPKSNDEISNAEITKENVEDKASHHENKSSKENVANLPETEENKEVVPKVVNEVKDDSKKELKPSTRPAYSQAAAKPKSSVASKTESRTQTRSTTPLYRSKTVVEMRPKTVPKTQKEFPKRNQMSKCSYPFNLTTGRTSLFDTNPSSCRGATPKKTMNRNTQMASGDSKPSQSRNDPKKRPPRPTSLKVNEDGKKGDKLNSSLEKIKDYEEYSGSDTIVPQMDRSRIESSESLKTLVAEDMQMAQEVSNSIEVLNIDNDKSDNDGWLTVKSRRLSRESKKQLKSHWANRFHQPSATTSLPTLNMIESPKQETKSIVISPIDAKTEITESVQRPEIEKKKEEVTVSEKEKIEQPKCEAKSKDPAMIGQKSDVTGLKTRPSRSGALRKERLKGAMRDDNVSELTKNRLHSSLESLTTTGLERSQESTEEAFDFDKWKAEFKNTFKYLDEDDQMSNHNEILKTADPSEVSEIAEMTSQIEENEKKLSWALDFQSEVDQRKLCEEEEILNRQILELQQVSDIDLDTETDDTETDAEILCEDTPVPSGSQENMDLTASLEDQYETALAGMSWAERMDTLFVLEELVARDPGRAQQLHAKLSQGIRRRGSLQDALRRLQAKQARAERQRLEYQMERTKKIHQLLARVEEVKVAKYQLIEEKRLRMERRLQKAAENRDQHLKDIVRKAHDEEEKLREIAFIKQLEAENRRHEFLDQCRSHTSRLRLVRRDRLQKLEQKAAREAAVGLRRQALEEARRLHVETLVERRRERDARAEELKELKRQERDDAARERAQGVRSRLSALAAAAELEAEALRSRIQDKQDASQQRLDRHLQAIRERATGPRPPTISESQEQASREQEEEEEEAVRHDQEKKERERQKNIKKKARKIRLKLLSTCKEDLLTNRHALAQTPNTQTNKMTKVVQQVMNTLATVMESDAKDDRVESNMNEFEIDLEERGGKKGKGKKKNGNDNDSKRSKKKNNGSNDKQKMAKTDSVCSSLSDMSKSSTNADWKPRPMFDSVLLERQLNEMNRTISKLDKSYTSWRIHALKPTTKLLSLIVDRDGVAPIFSTRCITTCVMLACRSISEITTWQILTTEAFVHMLKLYADLVEVDFESDPRERELVRFLIDHMCFAFDSLVRLSRNYLTPEFPTEVIDVLAYLRNRAFTVMSYLCLSGAISRGVSSFDLHDATIILLTAFTELFQPCDLDTGPERPSAIQSIKNTLGTDLGGCRAELCDMFARGAGVNENYQFMSAVRTVRFLRMWAEIDYQFVQDAFGEGKWPLEFRAAVARLLTQHATNVVEDARPNTGKKLTKREIMDQALSETMVLDLITLVGFVVVNNPQMQDTILDGWSVIKTLCNLPANWLVMTPHNEALLPTLVVLCERESTAKAIASEINMDMLESYVNEPSNQKIKLVQVIKQCRSKKTKK